MPEGMQAAPGHPAWWRRSLRARGTRSALVRGWSTPAASAALRRQHPQRGRAESFAGRALTEPGPPGLHAQRQTVPMSHSTHAVRSNPTDPLPSPGGHVAIPRGTLPRAPTLGLVGLTRNPGHAAYAQVPPVVGHTGNTLAWLPRLRRASRPQARTPPAGPAPRTLGDYSRTDPRPASATAAHSNESRRGFCTQNPQGLDAVTRWRMWRHGGTPSRAPTMLGVGELERKPGRAVIA